ncbi:DUF1499 domain-containing protein [Alterinioella nitratireducens]|uniref:DUF1499 domain-containing protein n=1 Tax=Alterinioella nitratireducens TaxID=2735915 RepID=UPI0015580F68|nr:DUF1499 domain-containing protein [Alterinioella nitratireducens]NPD20831.1 DUF1499 domain-containing protein [Alterinioella nitratireducens]
MRLSLQILLIALALVAGLALMIRVAPMKPARWHVDPETASRPSTPNAYILRDRDGDAPAHVTPLSPSDTAAALHRIVMSLPHTTRIAGDLAQGHATYVARTPLMRFPDAVSIKLTPAGSGTRVAIFSRSRFGQSDFGANRARVARIVAALEAEGP